MPLGLHAKYCYLNRSPLELSRRFVSLQVYRPVKWYSFTHGFQLLIPIKTELLAAKQKTVKLSQFDTIFINYSANFWHKIIAALKIP